MGKRLKQAAVFFVALFAAAQLIRPARANPPTDPTHSIGAGLTASNSLAPILNRSCGTCHSNETVWPWFAQVAPVSWLMAATVNKGRAAINFSEWTAYDPATRHALLVSSCDATSKGTMPGSAWTTLHREAQLSKADIETICAAARGDIP